MSLPLFDGTIDVVDTPILITKLHAPPHRPELVSRPHLLEELDAGLRAQRKLTLVSAPAGFGKTTLLSAWLSEKHEEAVAWLALDAEDNDPARFWNYVVAALRQHAPDLGRDALAALRDLHPPALPAILAGLINELAAHPTPLILVLDDYHLVENPAVHESLTFLLEHQPPQLHVAITTRVDPPLPLSRLRARGQMTELRSADLRFTAEEAAAFLNDAMGLGLAREDVAALAARTEGWITGLHLAALSLQSLPERHAFVVAFSGSHRYVVDYLMDEVLSRQPEEVRTFLRRTSILKRLSASLCDALLRDEEHRPAAEILEQLDRANLFLIPLDVERRWFRYHQLFADFQRRCLQEQEPELIPELHRRAGRWFAEAGEGDAAVRHALAAEDYAGAAKLLETHARCALLQGRVSAVESWFNALPEAWRAASPGASLSFAWALLLRGRYGEALTYLERAERALECGAEAQTCAAEVHAMQAIRAALQGEIAPARALAERAVSEAPSENTAAQGMAHFSMGTVLNYAGRLSQATAAYERAIPHCRAAGMTVSVLLAAANLAVMAQRQGRLHYAEEVCRREIEAQGEAAPHLPAMGSIYSIVGALRYEHDDLEGAQNYLAKGLQLCRLGGHYAATANTLAWLSRLYEVQGDTAAARSALEEAEALLRHGVPAWTRADVIARRVQWELSREDAAVAAEALERAGEAAAQLPAVQLARLRLWYRAGWYAEAREMADRGIAAAEGRQEYGTVVRYLTLRALLRDAQGEEGAALDDLRRALEYAAPEGYVRTFVDEGAPLADLLRKLGDEKGYAGELLPAFEVHAARTVPGAHPDLVEPLSERELEVLQVMAEGLTYNEIAERLFVSINTVRYHVKNIYSKLGVDNRAKALDRARELALIV